jgi:hypothetical protein
MIRQFRAAAVLAAAGVLASCAGQQHLAPNASSAAPYSMLPFGCYVTKVHPQTVSATITFYGRPDNTPPGRAIAHPVIHSIAAGTGTYCNPTTFATEVSNNAAIPYGIKIYVPFIKHYFIREDDCAPSGPPTGGGYNGCYKLWFDLWIGGDRNSNVDALVNCENSLTPNAKVNVILNPGSNLPVELPGPIYRDNPAPNGTCFGQPGQPASSTIFPN